MLKYIRFNIENLEPLRIANIYSSQAMQVETLRYIPGSTIRGAVINKLSRKLINFEQMKHIILKNIRFLNAYPMVNSIDLFPSPKGFYEDKKANGKIVNVLKDSEISGKKRAKLGMFSYVDGNYIKYTTNKYGETLNINTQSNDMYRMQYLKTGQLFSGYIILDDESTILEEDIVDILTSSEIRLGSDKSSGYGKCKIFNISVEDKYQFNKYSIKSDNTNYIYMLLLSNMSMINENGEICGIDEKLLADKLGVSSINMSSCATSVIEVSGINRTWGIRTPSVTMYQAGSVFKLESKEKFNLLYIRKLEDEGLGIKLTEGCGRVLFIDNYEKIYLKEEIKIDEGIIKQINMNFLDTDEKRMLRIISKAIFLNRAEKEMEKYVINENNNLQHIKESASDSQIGLMLTLCQNYSYIPDRAINKFEELFTHIEKDKNTIVNNKYRELIGYIRKTLYMDITEVLELKSKLCGYNIKTDEDIIKVGFLSTEEIIQLKLRLIENVLKYYLNLRGRV